MQIITGYLKTQAYHIDDIHPAAFRMFVKWLYCDSILCNNFSYHQDIPNWEDLITEL